MSNDAYGVGPDASGRAAIINALYERTKGGNPQTIDLRNYLSLSATNSEGALDGVSHIYGPETTKKLLQQLPNMTLPQLRQAAELIENANRQVDAERVRESRGTVGNGSYPR